MSLTVVHYDAPKLIVPHFACDVKLDEKLDEFELTSLMNRLHCCAFIGRAGSGKTSIALSMLQSKSIFRKVFTKILVCMPATSIASLKKNPFKNLPPGQIFNELTLDSLQSMSDMAKKEAEEKKPGGEKGRTLMIFDDVQAAMKVPAIERLLVHCNNNRRHRRTCIWICAQNYIKIPKSLRQGLTDMFLFSISKCDLASLHSELLEIPEATFEKIAAMFKKYRSEPHHAHSFLYWNASQRFFLDFDEVVPPDEDVGGLEASIKKMDDSDSD